MSEISRWISAPHIVDAHQDIADNAFCFKRDYHLSAERKRELEIGTTYPNSKGTIYSENCANLYECLIDAP